MNIKINDLYSVTEITSADKAAYIQHLAEKQIFDQTLNIPYPYRVADADWWINLQDFTERSHPISC